MERSFWPSAGGREERRGEASKRSAVAPKEMGVGEVRVRFVVVEGAQV